jgi:hypothetical protein
MKNMTADVKPFLCRSFAAARRGPGGKTLLAPTCGW